MDGCRECGVVGSHLFDCPDRIMELEKGILECQTRILALERELGEAKRERDKWEAARDVTVEQLNKALEDRDEAHAAIRALKRELAEAKDEHERRNDPHAGRSNE